MGNIGSRSGNITQRQPLEPELQWAHSFPRSLPRLNQHKVLPEHEISKKLRSTNNGEILHSGGTLSGRHYQQTLSLEREDKSFRIFRASSISSNSNAKQKDQSNIYVPRPKCHKNGAQRYENKNIWQKEQLKRFGSEPDLTSSSYDIEKNSVDKCKPKQKYKAPAPPTNLHVQEKPNTSWSEETNNVNNYSSRKARLFKTNAEGKKRFSTPLKNDQPLKSDNNLKIKLNDAGAIKTLDNETNLNNLRFFKDDFKHENRYSLPDISTLVGVSEFQAELKHVVEKIKDFKNDNNVDTMNELSIDNKEKLKTLDVIKKNHSKPRRNNVENFNESTLEYDNDRQQPYGKESTPEKSPLESTKSSTCREKTDCPSKIFYFGMNENEQNSFTDHDIVDNFAAKILTYKSRPFPISNSSESEISSELEMDENHLYNSSGIDLQLRPILPKKQLEIPRFSPAAAWKLLSTVESNLSSATEITESIPFFLEDRIERSSKRPPSPTMPAAAYKSTHDKSGDSGISGDAGDVPESDQISHALNRSKRRISWTPQQDLGEEDSSSDDDLENNQSLRTCALVKFTPKQNVFSLSLPRDNYSSFYKNGNEIAYFNGNSGTLQKLKRSVSGVLGNLNINKRDAHYSSHYTQNQNWFLSRSAPTSLNNGYNSLEFSNFPKSYDETWEQNKNLYNSSQNVSRLIYLPEFDKMFTKNRSDRKLDKKSRTRPDTFQERSQTIFNTKITASKSFENISKQNVYPYFESGNLHDPPKNEKLRVTKPKRFTFQSTIRQIERKRLAEKLSKEAERKEKQRLSELEAMQKVEEEFQRKRAREKASIRQQLRLFSLDEATWSSLPPKLQIKNSDLIRPEPDGAVSSLSSSSLSVPTVSAKQFIEVGQEKQISGSLDEGFKKTTTVTQILSEYRQAQREYKEFRGSPRYRRDFGEVPYYRAVTTIHPQITCDMPKVSVSRVENEGNSNYRKQFALGVKTNRSAESTYSDDSQSFGKNYSPKMYNDRHSQISRF